MDLFTLSVEHDLLNAQAQSKKDEFNLGLMYNGLAGLNIHFIPYFTTPGAAIGII